MDIDRTNWVGDSGSYKTKSVKTQIVIANSLRKSDYHIVRLQHKDMGLSKTWNTFTVSRDGKVFQHYDHKHHSDFLGVKEGDMRSISVVLENMGSLFRTKDGRYLNWLNEGCDGSVVSEKKWMGYSHWENYGSEQMEVLFELCCYLCDEHNIPKRCIDFQLYHNDIIKYKGVVFKSNYIEDSAHMNPMFNIIKLNQRLNEYL